MKQETIDQIVEAFDPLLASLMTLKNALLEEASLPCWVQSGDRMLEHNRPRVAEIYSQIEYANDQEGRETIVCPGLVGCTEDTLNKAIAVNQAKEEFKRTMLSLKADIKHSDRIILHHVIQGAERKGNLRPAMVEAGLSRLHLKQCYRRLPILTEPPVKVSWTWTHTRSIQKITLDQAEQRLLSKPEDGGINAQLASLRNLPPSESLAIVQNLSPHCCANILFKNGERKMLKGPVPILYRVDPEMPAPEVVPPTTERSQKSDRATRSDRKVSDECFLPAIRAHRYV